VKIGRYLLAALVAEVIGILALFLFQMSSLQPNSSGMRLNNALSRFSDSGGTYNFDSKTGLELSRLMDQGLPLAHQLDLLDNCIPFVIGFPAIAVLSLWTFDQRKQKTSA
jgi:hypothetical protein